MPKIKVTAGEGRMVPIPPHLGTSPGARTLILKPGEPLEVDDGDAFVSRARDNGDLVLLEATPRDASTLAPHATPHPTPTPQRVPFKTNKED